MKKIFLAIMAAVVALTFTACSEETADVKWTDNYPGTSVDPVLTEIKWISAGEEDASWITQLNSVGDTTEIQTITSLAGQGECQDDGYPGIIEIDPNSDGVALSSGTSTTIEGGVTANLIITGSTAKKK